MTVTSLRVLLVDDEALALERLEALFDDIDGTEVVGTALDGREALEKIEALTPDLVMLDIQMPGKSGLRVAADLPAEKRPEIVFATAFERYAPDAFDVEAADYLLKPVRFDRLRQAVERAKRRKAMREALESAGAPPTMPSEQPSASDRASCIWVQVRDGQVRLPVAQIDWIEAAGDYVMLHTATRSYIHRESMTNLEAVLDPGQLLRVHRSAFVRPTLVEKIERYGKGLVALVLKDGASVQVGSTYVKAVLARLGA